ncbi:MAG: endonuclease III [Deltaproteobacteria bacterium]|nr:endonuclease III [Deltaproteobacteria bacterium]
MNKQEKADRILDQLETLYPNPPIPLDHKDPYTLMIAVLLSAQTTDKKVNEVTPALFARADNAHDMAKVDVDEIKHFIRQIGLSTTKAKNIKKLSEILVEQADGEVPKTMEGLEALPGVGHKTASVVMIQAYGVPAFPVDTHIHRLADRWGLSSGKSVQKTEEDCKKLFAKDKWIKLHLQIIYFGREYCPARSHDLSQCPICSWAATQKRIAAEAEKLPARMRKPKK